MSSTQITALVHSLVVVAGIAGYVVLTATGHDGNAVLAAAIAWGSGAGVEKAIASSSSEQPRSLTPPSN